MVAIRGPQVPDIAAVVATPGHPAPTVAETTAHVAHTAGVVASPGAPAPTPKDGNDWQSFASCPYIIMYHSFVCVCVCEHAGGEIHVPTPDHCRGLVLRLFERAKA